MEENIIVSDRDGNENRGPRKSRRKLFWGIVLVTGAVAMLMNRLGYLGGVGFWQMVFTVILAAVFLNGILRRSFSQMMLSVAVFVIVMMRCCTWRPSPRCRCWWRQWPFPSG